MHDRGPSAAPFGRARSRRAVAGILVRFQYVAQPRSANRWVQLDAERVVHHAPRHTVGSSTRSPLAMLGVLLLMASCSDGTYRPDSNQCDPRINGGCAPTEICRLVAGGRTACLTPGPAPVIGCTLRSCPPREACLDVEGLLSCHPACRVDDDCPASARCALTVGTADESGRYPWKACLAKCTLEQGCEHPSATCALAAGISFPICVRAGPRREGDPCDAYNRCSSGLACLAYDNKSRCKRLCTSEGDCRASNTECLGPLAGLDEPNDLRYCADPADATGG